MDKHKYNGVQAAMFDEFVVLLNRVADEGYHVVGCGRELGQWWALMELKDSTLTLHLKDGSRVTYPARVVVEPCCECQGEE
jgi:hypothetical protein